MDVFMISEKKSNDSFRIGNFLIDGFSTQCRSDRNANDNEVILYVQLDISSNMLAKENVGNGRKTLCRTGS